jgi:electron transport complex protein RnfA
MNVLFLPLLAGIAGNSYLQFGFGIQELLFRKNLHASGDAAPSLAIFLTGLFSWILFNYIVAPLGLGFMEAFLLIPLSISISVLTERIILRISRKEITAFSTAHTAYDGLAYASAYLTLRLSADLLAATAVSLGSAFGFLVCGLLLRALRAHLDTEPIPRCLRGIPSLLIASGLIALIASFSAFSVFIVWGKPL